MQIAVITVEREPMYLYETLASLRASHPFHAPWFDVFVGSPAFDKINTLLDERWRSDPADRIFAHPIPHDLWALIEPLPPAQRAVGNFVAALRSSGGDLMLFEDDVIVKPGWIAAVGDLRTTSFPEPCNTFISLYSHKDYRPPGFDPRRILNGLTYHMPPKPIAPDAFYGTLGLYVPAAHRKPLAELALTHLQPEASPGRFPRARSPFDEIVKEYINAHQNCDLAITIPSFVDHVGDVSTINPTHGIRRAPMF